MFFPLIGDRCIRGRGEINDGRDGWNACLFVFDDVPRAQNGRECGGRVVQCDLWLRGKAAGLSVQRIGDVSSCRRQILGAQQLAERTLPP